MALLQFFIYNIPTRRLFQKFNHLVRNLFLIPIQDLFFTTVYSFVLELMHNFFSLNIFFYCSLYIKMIQSISAFSSIADLINSLTHRSLFIQFLLFVLSFLLLFLLSFILSFFCSSLLSFILFFSIFFSIFQTTTLLFTLFFTCCFLTPTVETA